MNQFLGLIDGKEFKDYECVCCGKKGHLQSNGWRFRLCIHFEKNVWIRHQRLRCKNGCGSTFGTISPEFMKQLPTCIVDAFTFLTTHSGIGISAAMMDQFLYLITLGVSFGPKCNSINELRMSHYWAQLPKIR